MVEARIRLGRVLGLRGRHEEAVAQLQQGLSATEPLLQDDAHLFLAAELDALGKWEDARRSYQRAAALYPTAQSPLLGLSRVASQLGDREAAREAIGRVLKLPADEEDRVDPWWSYEFAPHDGRCADRRSARAVLRAMTIRLVAASVVLIWAARLCQLRSSGRLRSSRRSRRSSRPFAWTFW